MALLLHNQTWKEISNPLSPESVYNLLNELKAVIWVLVSLKGPLGTLVVDRPKRRSLGHRYVPSSGDVGDLPIGLSLTRFAAS